MPTYTITRVSSEPPREWAPRDKPEQKTYYHKVQLDGHPKPVSVGKKKPNSLRVGDTINGTIEKTAMAEDKWHPEALNPGGGGQGSSRPAYQPKDEHAIAKAVALKAAVDFRNEMDEGSTPEDCLKVADKFLAWLEGDKLPTITHQTTPATHADPQPGYDKARATADAIRQKQGQPATALQEELTPEFYDVPPEGEGW